MSVLAPQRDKDKSVNLLHDKRTADVESKTTV